VAEILQIRRLRPLGLALFLTLGITYTPVGKSKYITKFVGWDLKSEMQIQNVASLESKVATDIG